MKDKKNKLNFAFGGTAMNIDSPSEALAKAQRVSQDAYMGAMFDPLVMGLNAIGGMAASKGLSMITQGIEQGGGLGEIFGNIKESLGGRPNIDGSSSGTTAERISHAMGGTAKAAINAEGGEVLETPQGQITELQGPSHEGGGMDMDVPSGTEIFSKRLKGEDGKPVIFSGKYVQSWDIDKNILESIKAVGDSKWTTENVFKMDSNNQIMKDKSGAPIYSEYAIKEIREGRFSENVAAAIDSVLTRPEAKQELTMRGVYNYRGYNDINQFVKEYDDEKNIAIKNNESKKFELMAAFTTEKDPEVKKQIQALITKTDAEITSLQNNEDPRVTDAKQFGDLDAYKAAKETRKVRNQYMTSGVTEHISREYIKSIPYEVAREKIKDERDWWSKQDASNRGWFTAKDNSARGWANINIAEKSYQLNKRKTDAALGIPGALGAGDYGAEKPVQPGELYASMLTEGEELTNTHNGEVKKFVFDYIKMANKEVGVDQKIVEWQYCEFLGYESSCLVFRNYNIE